MLRKYYSIIQNREQLIYKYYPLKEMEQIKQYFF